MNKKDLAVTLSKGATLIGVSRQTLWEWAQKGWISPLPQASKTGGRPALLYSAEMIVQTAEERLILSKDQAAEARDNLRKQIDKGDKGDNN